MVLKRFRPRARGRAGKILKTFSRIRIMVQEKEETSVKEKKLNNQQKKDKDGSKN